MNKENYGDSISVPKEKVFFPNLDGLRFFCFLSVFFYHSFSTHYANISSSSVYCFIKESLFVNGDLGVNFFFVLSGFLITYLLLKEKELTGKIHVGKFYLRRIFRIWPLYYLCILFGFIAFPILKHAFGQIPDEPANPWYYIAFLGNFDMLKHFPDCSGLSVLWSLAIEEQFYLVWPILLFIVPVKYYPFIFYSVIAGSFIFRCTLYHNPMAQEIHTFSCISDMAMGGLAAYYAFRKGRVMTFIKELSKWSIGGIYLMAIVLYFFSQYIFASEFMSPMKRLVVGVVFALIILEQNFSGKSLFKTGNNKTISKLGQYTYGLYCLHMFGILITETVLNQIGFNNHLWQVLFIEGTLSLAITFTIAYISYTFFESRFLRLKNKFSYILHS